MLSSYKQVNRIKLNAAQRPKMTTKFAYKIQSVIDYESLSFNPDDPEPLPDGMFQYPIFEEIFSILGTHLDSLYPPGEVFRSSNTFICYDPNNLNVRVGPDFYAAFGVDAQAIMQRKIYLPWEVRKPPDFVLEVASESTARQDVGPKRRTYAQIGIPEYWRFDSTGGEFYGEALAGDQLAEGVYQPIELTTEPDGILKGYSPSLGLSLCWREGMLAFYDHETGAYLRNYKEEQAAREAAEARIRQLEEELRRQGRGR
jgi:Uma2 family endonuclease